MHPTWPTRRPILRVAHAAKPKVVAIGDSYIAQHHGAGYQAFHGPINVANAILGQRFAFTAAENLGVGGQRTPEIAARMPQALAAQPDLLMICAGSNDVRSRISPADTRAALTAMAEAAEAAGIDVLFLTVPPRTSENWPDPEQQAHAMAANDHLAALAVHSDRVDRCDWIGLNVAPSPGYVALPGTTYDGTHLSAVGAWNAGVVLADRLLGRFPQPATRQPSTSLLSERIVPLPGGRAGEGVGGVVAQGWHLRRHAGTATLEAALAPEGQDIFVVSGTVDSGFLFEPDPVVVNRSLVPGHRVRGFAHVTAHASAAWDHLFLEVLEQGVDGNANRALYPATQVRPLPGDAEMQLSLLTDPIELIGNSGIRLRFRFGIRGGIAASARLTIHQMDVRLA